MPDLLAQDCQLTLSDGMRKPVSDGMLPTLASQVSGLGVRACWVSRFTITVSRDKV
jgi:hypothetical protein